eukprot:tig00020539_g10414.t1
MAQGAVYDGKLFYFGGRDASWTPTDDLFYADLTGATSQWITVAQVRFDEARQGGGAWACGPMLFLARGSSGVEDAFLSTARVANLSAVHVSNGQQVVLFDLAASDIPGGEGSQPAVTDLELQCGSYFVGSQTPGLVVRLQANVSPLGVLMLSKRVANFTEFVVEPVSPTAVRTAPLSWVLTEDGEPGTPFYSGLVVTCSTTHEGRSWERQVVISDIPGGASGIPGGVILDGFPESSTSYSITCNAKLSYSGRSAIGFSQPVLSSAAKRVLAIDAFTLQEVSSTSVRTSAIGWTLSADGAPGSPSYSLLRVTCETDGSTASASFIGPISPGSTSAALQLNDTNAGYGVVVEGLPDTSLFNAVIDCTTVLRFSSDGVVSRSSQLVRACDDAMRRSRPTLGADGVNTQC